MRRRPRLALATLEERIQPALSYVSYFGGDTSDEITSVAFDPQGNIYIAGRLGSDEIPLGGPPAAPQDGAFVAKLDPTATNLIYCTYVASQSITGLAVDAAGEAYITGNVTYAGFATGGAAQTIFGGQQDAYAAKLNAAGTGFIYATYIGGNQIDQANGIAIDSAGNAFVTGYTLSGNFPNHNALQGTLHVNSGEDAFITKVSPTGGSFVFSTYLGGNANGPGDGNGATVSIANAIATDKAGNVYVTGITEAADFATSANAFQTTKGYAQDVFATELKADGSQVLYSTFLSGPGQTVDSLNGEDIGYAIKVDGGGNIVVAGSTTSIHFPLKNAFVRKEGNGSPALRDGFVTKLDPAKTGDDQLVYSTYIGGSAIDDAYSIGLDPAGNAYVGGATSSHINFPLVKPFQKTFQSGGFLAKFAPNGHVLFNSYNAVGADTVEGIGVSPFGHVVFVGSSNSATMHTTDNAFQPDFPGGTDHGFIAMLGGDNKAGSGIAADGDTWSVHLGGPGAISVTADPVTGAIQSIALQGTTSRSSLSIKVRTAKMGDGYVDVGSITGSGIGHISGAHANLTGTGINLAGSLGALTIHDISGGSDVLAAGTATDSTGIKAHDIGAGTTINVGGSLRFLRAARIGTATIQAVAIKSLVVTGDKRAAITGDFAGLVTLTSSDTALISARIAGIWTGTLTANMGEIRSFIAANFDGGGVTADRVGKVRLAAVKSSNGGVKFGFTAHTSIGSIRVGKGEFMYDSTMSTPQSDGDFEVNIA